MRNTIRMNSATMRENTTPTMTLAIADKQHDETAERADRHQGEAVEDAGNAEQHDQADHQPVERLDDRRRDEAVPLEQVLKIEHRSSPRLIEMVVGGHGWPSPETSFRTSPDRPREISMRRCHAYGRVEIAANNGHNRASLRHFSPRMTTLTFEDFKPGRSARSAHATCRARTSSNLPAKFDPQPMHRTRRPPAARCSKACPARAGISAR